MSEKDDITSVEPEAAVCFRDQLRCGRDTAVKDSEEFSEILFAVERLGSFLLKEIATLDRYRPAIQRLACASPLSRDVPKHWSELHLPFYRLYELVMWARNDALHQGAYARHLTSRAIELSIVLEDALMSNLGTVGDFMVRDPLCCSLWQPLSFIRQQILMNSFSYLPVYKDNTWQLVSDQEVARYLRVNADLRKDRLVKSLSDALVAPHSRYGIVLTATKTVKPTDSVIEIAHSFCGVPILVTRDGSQGDLNLIGILTAFDL